MGAWNLEFLDKDGIEAIHSSSMRILSAIGIVTNHAAIHKEMKDYGIEESRDHRLLLSEEVVGEAIKKSRKHYTIHARNPKNNLEIGSGSLRFLSSGGQAWITDSLRKERGQAARKDLHDAIVVGDALENINIVGSMVIPQDMPVSGRSVYVYSELIKNSSKVVFSWIEDPQEALHILRLFEVLSGGEENHRERPMIWYFCEPVSPLRFRYESLETLRLFCAKGLPVSFGPMVQAGCLAQ